MDLKKVRKNPESGKKTSNFYVTSQSAGRSHPMILTCSEDLMLKDTDRIPRSRASGQIPAFVSYFKYYNFSNIDIWQTLPPLPFLQSL